MKVFHNDPAIADKYIARVKAHIAADHLVRGIGWDGGKGCAVGCTIEAYDHVAYERELGIPAWLAGLEDGLFEAMSLEKSRNWPLLFLQTCKEALGADLDRIKAPFWEIVFEFMLKTFNHRKFPYVKTAVDDVITLWQRQDIDSKDWTAVAKAAANAAWYAAANAAGYAAAKAAANDYFADQLILLIRKAGSN